MLGGEVLFNSCPRDGAFWRESAYVKQDDVHIPVLTVQVCAHTYTKQIQCAAHAIQIGRIAVAMSVIRNVQ